MRAAIYVRQSKDQHATGLAVERQGDDCRRLAAERGWNVVQVFVDNDVSASNGSVRRGYQELLRLADERAIDVIVCWHLDRLTRRVTELEDVIERCERAGVRVATVSGDLDLSTDAGRLVGRILASVARGEVERKSARQKRAARQAAEIGRPPSRRAFGFAPGGMDIVPEEAAAVRDAYAQLLAGASIVTITNRLNAAGMLSTRGKPWARTMVRAMLLNSRNAAIRTYRGEEIGPGMWPAIVPEETYRAAVAILDDPVRRKNLGTTARRWLGGGLFQCGRCDAPVRVGYREGGTRVYQCSQSKHLARAADPVDDLVERVIVARLRREDLRDLLAADHPDVAKFRTDAAALRERLDQVAADYADGAINARQLQIATTRVEGRLAEVTKQLAEAGRASRLGIITGADDPGQAWLDSDVGARRAVVDALATVTLLPGKAGRAPFDPETVAVKWRTG